ncbi:Lecithin retinol acyltransferase domain-containing protein [Phytophthora infestans]|uniref:Lecithin retinol acyltransferase domain-containing protein n=1 Tax=Phytophthora infestans TaxID=4787 RepID=A0A833SIX6_PHYIN|nr:Lecithin retinol acyltransferase domain-containing protein [Phytophthora infestans]KAF4137558.1 Lecithin retinol acyltransferase domain-containing protein [Phytophthora infestans]
MGNANSHAVKVGALRPGDHIFIWDHTHWPFSYQHHGIVWASGDSVEGVRVCHVWTPLEGFQQAQNDSNFRVSTLGQFLYHRSVDDLRVVEYDDTKLFRRMADRPDIVLARCRLLLGRGRGDYHPITQNCEHAARWCKTGRQWCWQTLTPGHGDIPFEDQLRKVDVLALEHQVEAIRMAAATSTLAIDCAKHQGLRVKVSGKTLFWMDSFSTEVVDVRKRLARRVFNWPPTAASIYHFRLKTNPIDLGSLQHANWPRHVEFAASYLKIPRETRSYTIGQACDVSCRQNCLAPALLQRLTQTNANGRTQATTASTTPSVETSIVCSHKLPVAISSHPIDHCHSLLEVLSWCRFLSSKILSLRQVHSESYPFPGGSIDTNDDRQEFAS